MMLQTYSEIPMYRTSSRVMIQDERSVAVGNLNANDPAFWQDSDPYFNTQYQHSPKSGLADASSTGCSCRTIRCSAPRTTAQGHRHDDLQRAAQGEPDGAIAARPGARDATGRAAECR